MGRSNMSTLAGIFLGFMLAGAPVGKAVAQPPGLPLPELQNRIPQPLPPAPRPPVINGPLSQSPPPDVYLPRRLNTHGDRAIACLHEGSAHGLRGRKLDAYTRACANAN
jgi:hypothetical protein